MTFIVKGPHGNGTVQATAERPPAPTDEPWTFTWLTVATFSDFGVQVVKLVEAKPPTGRVLPEPTPEAKEKYGID